MGTKTQHMELVFAGKVNELLQYRSTHDSNLTVYDVSALRRMVNEGRMGPDWHIIGVPTSCINDPSMHYTVDEDRVRSIVLKDTEQDPVYISITVQDGVVFHHLIDGIHRLHRMYREGIEMACGIAIPDAEIPRASGLHLTLDWGGAVPTKKA